MTAALVAGSPPERARRIALGQVIGFWLIAALAAGAAAVLFEFSPKVVGLLGLVPLALGLHGLIRWRGRERGTLVTQRAVGSGFAAALLVTLSAGGDNLAAYIPLFRVGGAARVTVIVGVFALGEVVVSALALLAGGHPRARAAMTRFGALAVPVLLCCVGILILVEAGAFSLV